LGTSPRSVYITKFSTVVQPLQHVLVATWEMPPAGGSNSDYTLLRALFQLQLPARVTGQ